MIEMTQLIGLLNDGWVAMDENGRWCWYSVQPERFSSWWVVYSSCEGCIPLSDCFNIAPFKGDWKDSLIKCGGNNDRNRN